MIKKYVVLALFFLKSFSLLKFFFSVIYLEDSVVILELVTFFEGREVTRRDCLLVKNLFCLFCDLRFPKENK